MKYFTPELIARLGSTDEDVADAADAEWDEIHERYVQHLQEIRSRMPEHQRQVEDLLLHDADVWSMARQADKFIVVLRKNIPPRELVILTYTLTAEPVIDTEALAEPDRSPVMQFLYNELDLVQESDPPVYSESILFSNGWEIQLRFRDVHAIRADEVYSVFGTPQVPLPTPVGAHAT